MLKNQPFRFNDEIIQQLFGFEDAESESIGRLREYYLKKDTYQRVTSNLPLRILVGHKGTGKSALFKVAMVEEKEKGNLPILIKPDDIAELGRSDEDFLLKIRQWKYGLIKIIGAKVLSELGLYDEDAKKKLSLFGVKLISFLSKTISTKKVSINLEPTQQLLVDNFLKSKKIIVFIDDLDRGWQGRKDDIQRISALLNAIRDFSNENNGLSFKVSLRSDVFFLVRTSDESTDKIESSVVWFSWTNHEILVMLIKRIATFFEEPLNEQKLLETPQRHLVHYLERIFENPFQGRGKWEKVSIHKILMSLVRKRPRDLVKLCSSAAQIASSENSSKIKSSHLQRIFEEYSQGRIQDTINEYKSELPKIENLIFGMRPNNDERKKSSGYIFKTSELQYKINMIKESNNFKFANKRVADAKSLAQFLYKINFITGRKVLESGEIQRRYFEESRYLYSSFVDFGYDWEIHPAFRWALQPENLNDIMNQLALSSDN
ncbi:P-loop ATPase, Sll1717 family [Aquimarina sediminis]|uniref:P-loop ATPase, Sll1717 family n=1 Tax=Aquimarina sediminis TaxID=2070536 RepID=UPI000CA01E9F|nr:AAA family ATPase [Aquimarina sediminis]